MIQLRSTTKNGHGNVFARIAQAYEDGVRVGEANARDELLDDLVERWHQGQGFGVPLHEWLRMTPAQYQRWLLDPKDGHL